MSKHTEAIRAALAKNPTLGAWIAELGEAYVVRSQADGGRVAICTNLRGFHGMGGRRDGDEVAANAHLIAACNPVNIAALLAERDALLEALIEMHEAGIAVIPAATEGQAAQEAWAERRADAHTQARFVIAKAKD